jgi:hypothetical protein
MRKTTMNPTKLTKAIRGFAICLVVLAESPLNAPAAERSKPNSLPSINALPDPFLS